MARVADYTSGLGFKTVTMEEPIRYEGQLKICAEAIKRNDCPWVISLRCYFGQSRWEYVVASSMGASITEAADGLVQELSEKGHPVGFGVCDLAFKLKAGLTVFTPEQIAAAQDVAESISDSIPRP